MTFNILTIFPGIFDGFVKETMVKRALAAGVVKVNLVNIRDHATDKHHTTDDTPYGGGPGMVMKVEPIYRALRALAGLEATGSRQQATGRGSRHEVAGRRTVLLSARGKQLDQRVAEKYAKLDTLTLICGRYEGVDQRVADHLCDEEISIGPYVLSGGEVPAMVAMEAVARLVPGFLGNPESLKEESFALPEGSRQETVGSSRKRRAPTADSLLPTASVEYPQYTKPEDFLGWKVPTVLTSGNHAKIEEWRKRQTKKL